MSAPLPPVRDDLHYGQQVWDDEDGEAYYMAGHVPKRRALAAANRYARTVCGFVNLYDAHGTSIEGWLNVHHVWWRPSEYAEVEPGAMEPCSATDPGAEPFTEVTL